MDSKSGKITWGRYTELYLDLLRERYRLNKKPFLDILDMRENVVLTCYCTSKAKCHRHLALDVLTKIAKHHKIPVATVGELPHQDIVKVSDPFELQAHSFRLPTILELITGVKISTGLGAMVYLMRFMTQDANVIFPDGNVAREITPYIHEQLPFTKHITHAEFHNNPHYLQAAAGYVKEYGKWHTLTPMRLEDRDWETVHECMV